MSFNKLSNFSKEQFYFLQQLHQLNYSNIDTFININKQNQKSIFCDTDNMYANRIRKEPNYEGVTADCAAFSIDKGSS